MYRQQLCNQRKIIYYDAVACDDRVLRTDGRVEDVGDFTDFYVQPDKNLRATEKKSLQELQDEVRCLISA